MIPATAQRGMRFQRMSHRQDADATSLRWLDVNEHVSDA